MMHRINAFFSARFQRGSAKGGFTLIEILIVVTIIAILGAIIVPRFIDMPQKARVTAAKQSIQGLRQALDAYSMERGNYPSSDEGINKLVEEGYLQKKKEALKDPWGNPYQYRFPGESNPNEPDIWSFGADGKEGGEGVNADIKSWE